MEKMTGTDCDFSAMEAKWKKTTIYRIPFCFTSLKEARVYQPQMVSIGPYHHANKNLKAMQIHKHRAQSKFLNRCKKSLDEILHLELWQPVQDLKDTYDELDDPEAGRKGPDDDNFLKMMVLDGCFILELLRATAAAGNYSDYSEDDRIFSKHGKLNLVPYLKRDMLMLENQIPMKVLQVLDSLDPLQQQQRVPLTKRILDFYSQTTDSKLKDCSHILDLYRKSLIFEPKDKTSSSLWSCIENNVSCLGQIKRSGTQRNDADQIKRSETECNNADQIIRSAMDLKNAGIKIRKSKTKSLKDISFKWGLTGFYSAVLRLPSVVVDEAFESTYLNLIAYERLHPRMGNDVTSYVFFMDNIIENVQDVKLLHLGGAIQNALGSEEAVANLFNSLSANSTLDPEGDMQKIHDSVSKYCGKKLHIWRAYFCQHYFTNPWVVIAVVAAVSVFAVTIVQTWYTISSYYKSSSE